MVRMAKEIHSQKLLSRLIVKMTNLRHQPLCNTVGTNIPTTQCSVRRVISSASRVLFSPSISLIQGQSTFRSTRKYVDLSNMLQAMPALSRFTLGRLDACMAREEKPGGVVPYCPTPFRVCFSTHSLFSDWKSGEMIQRESNRMMIYRYSLSE